jgi:nitric oxide dioxygenase
MHLSTSTPLGNVIKDANKIHLMRPEMLTAFEIDAVKATLPFLRERGVELTQRMYEILFEDAGMRRLFNASHQGPAGAQPRALAQAVLAYGENIASPGLLADMVERIAHRHVSLGIEAHHYPVVGAAILRALRDILGNTPGADVAIAAWGAAYGELAALFIAREGVLAEASATQAGGWRGWRQFRVCGIMEESVDVRSYSLAPCDNGVIAAYKPGQYVTVSLNSPQPEAIVRSYSLSDAPRADRYRITIKRESEGVASRRLYDTVTIGSEIALRAPAGSFCLSPGHRPIVLLSGGVGLTPMMAILEAVAISSGPRPVLWAHATRDGTHHSFKHRVRELAQQMPLHTVTWYEQPKDIDRMGHDYDHAGRITGAALSAACVALVKSDIYVCGPKPFMVAMQTLLTQQGVPEAQIRKEVFGPDTQAGAYRGGPR